MDAEAPTLRSNGAANNNTNNTSTGLLGSFLRGRRHSNSHLNPPPPVPHSPNQESANPFAFLSGSPTPSSPQPPPMNHSHSTANPTDRGGGAFSGILRRRRSAGQMHSGAPAGGAASTPPPVPVPGSTTPVLAAPGPPAAQVSSRPNTGGAATPTGAAAAAPSGAPAAPSGNGSGNGTGNGSAAPGAPAHRIRLVPHLESRRSLRFDAISRDVRPGDTPLRIGRFTDRSGSSTNAPNSLNSNKLAFKSKVVSRTHAEISVDAAGKFWIKDTKSSSGTFLNHVRLSPANAESRAHELRDGDMLQLGVDYQGGAEDIYKCVKIRVEIGREWQAVANAFNTNALKQLKGLAQDLVKTKEAKDAGKKVSSKTGLPDCCICLFAVSIQQALFIAPCSHAFHYKCLRPLLDTHYPAFVCPLCRTFADLEADVEVDAEEWEDTPDPASPAVKDDAMGGGMETEVEGPNGNEGAGTGAGGNRLGAGMRRLVSSRGGPGVGMEGLDEEDEGEDQRSLNDGEMGSSLHNHNNHATLGARRGHGHEEDGDGDAAMGEAEAMMELSARGVQDADSARGGVSADEPQVLSEDEGEYLAAFDQQAGPSFGGAGMAMAMTGVESGGEGGFGESVSSAPKRKR